MEKYIKTVYQDYIYEVTGIKDYESLLILDSA
jgi:hypothetical protein